MTPKDDLAKLDEIIDACIIALTSYTQGDHKITSYDEVVIDRPKLVSKTAQLITDAKIDSLEKLKQIWHTDRKTMDYTPDTFDFIIDKEIAELKALGYQ